MIKKLVSVIGAGTTATKQDIEAAHQFGILAAQNGWIILSGGRETGVMNAVNQGAKEANGFTIGLLPNKTSEGVSKYVDVPLYTAMSSGRNYLLALSGHVIVACGVNSPGTLSEIALSMNENKPIVLINPDPELIGYLKKVYENLYIVQTAEQAADQVKELFKTGQHTDFTKNLG